MVQTYNNKQEIIKKPIIYEFHVDILTNKKTGLRTAFLLIDGLFNYIFDDYKRKDNYIKVNYGGFNKENPLEFYYLTCSELILHLLFWYLNYIYSTKIKKEIHITKDDFTDLIPFNSDKYNKIMNNSMKKFINDVTDINELSFYTSRITDFIIEIEEGYSKISSNTVSLYDIIQLSKRSKEFYNCINTKLDEKKSIKEIEDQIKVGKDLVMKTIINDGKSSLIPYILSNRMNKDQFTQMFYAVGPRTDIDKTILPKIFPTNYLRGYDSVSSYYIDSITGRDAQIVKHTNVRESGYLSRKMNLACLNTNISKDVKDCGTKHFLLYNIKNKDYLNSVDGKYYINDKNKLSIINAENDIFLIGQTIKLRSHICCTLDNNDVCQTCFGDKYKQMKNTRIGGLPSVKLANVLSKLIMKSKHFTTTKSIDINNKLIAKYFDIEQNKFYLKNTLDLKNCFIVINREYVEEIIDGSVIVDDDGVDVMLPLEFITMRYNGIDEVIECDGMFLTLTDELLEECSKFILDLDSDDALIPLFKIERDIPIFNLVIITEEVSRYLKKLKQMIDTNRIKEYSTYHDFVQKFMDLLIESGLTRTKLIHVETITYHLIRDLEKIYLRPDFKKEEVLYQFISLSQSILNSDIYTSIAFQEFKSVMKNIDNYEQKNSGMLNNLFKTRNIEYFPKFDINYIKSLRELIKKDVISSN